MLTKELVKKLKAIEIKTRRKVEEHMGGHYHSTFKGQGMEFDEVRAYQAGDDIRSIDWNVTARTGEPFIKKFTEERELTVMIVVDMSGSTEYGSGNQTKRELAAELTALFAFSAIKNQDKVGCLIFTDHVELFVPPAKGRTHVLRLIREILAFDPVGVATDISDALSYLLRVLKKKAVVFIISDFMDEDYSHTLSMARRRHDLIALSLIDKMEINPPTKGLLILDDGETGQEIADDFGSKKVSKAYIEHAENNRFIRNEKLRKNQIDHIELFTGEEYEKSLLKFFKQRENRQMIWFIIIMCPF